MSASCCDGAHPHAHGDDPAAELIAALPALQDRFLARSLGAYALLAQGRHEEAVASYAALRAESADAPLQDLVGLELCEALALDALGRHDEALGRRAGVVARIEAAGGPLAGALRAQGQVALYDIGLRLIRRAKERWRAGEIEEARGELAGWRRRLTAHPALADAALLRLLDGYAAHLLDRREDAAAALEAALAQDPQPVRETARTLRALSPLPADEAFAALLDPAASGSPLVRLRRG